MGWAFAFETSRKQSREDSRAIGRLLFSDTFAPIHNNIDEIIKRDGFNSFESADCGIVRCKAIIHEALNALPTLLSIARRAADVEAIRAVTAKASSEWTGPNPAEFATGVAFVTKPHFVATAVSRYVMGETTPVSIADIGDDEEVGR